MPTSKEPAGAANAAANRQSVATSADEKVEARSIGSSEDEDVKVEKEKGEARQPAQAQLHLDTGDVRLKIREHFWQVW
jgi:hypothetical protein